MPAPNNELCDAVRTYVQSLPKAADVVIDTDTPLISGGVLDSLSLLQLLTWVQNRVTRPIDIVDGSVIKRLDTIRGIAALVEEYSE